MADRYVIVGGGQAAVQACATLRAEGYDGQLTLVGDEGVLPYQRPPLSKKYLAGGLDAARLLLKPAAFYEQAGVELRLGTHVAALDCTRRVITTDGGEELAYGALLLATGARPRKLSIPGAEHLNYIRSVADIDGLRPRLVAGRRLVIAGGGYVGLEIAASATLLGLDVSVVEVEERLLARVAGPSISAFFSRAHSERGVTFHMGCRVEGVTELGDGSYQVALSTGELINGDIIVAGIGAVPNAELAEAAGLDVDDGIIVDANCRTSDPHVYAAGDCTRQGHRVYGPRLRLESVPNAIEQGRIAAMAMVGKPAVSSKAPWFWSDQFDIKFQAAGIHRSGDTPVVTGDPETSAFSVAYYRDGALVAVEAVNAPVDFLAGRAAIDRHLISLAG